MKKKEDLQNAWFTAISESVEQRRNNLARKGFRSGVPSWLVSGGGLTTQSGCEEQLCSLDRWSAREFGGEDHLEFGELHSRYERHVHVHATWERATWRTSMQRGSSVS